MSETKILILVGSLRSASVNRQLADLAVDTAPQGVRVTIFEGLGELPFYDEDLDRDDAPGQVSRLRAAAADTHATLVVTPENNGSIPAVLKNAIDWLSRPYGHSVLADKPLAVIGAALGRTGGAAGHDETRRSFNSFGGGLPRVLEHVKLSVSTKRFADSHPRDDAEFAANVRDVVARLAAEVG